MIKKNNYTILIHIFAWLMLFLLPLFLFTKNKEFDTTFYMMYLYTPISLCFIFYLNYLFLINRYLLNEKLKQFIIINAIVIGVICGVGHVWENNFSPHRKAKKIEHVQQPENNVQESSSTLGIDSTKSLSKAKHENKKSLHKHNQRKSRFLWWHIIWNVISLVCMVGMAIAIQTTCNWYINKEKEAEKRRTEIEAELKNLKSQLNPHFLFNTLNNIYALIAISQEKSQEAVMELSKLLRYVLYESDKEFVPLSKELEFTSNYIELMKLRLQSNVELEVNIQDNNKNIIIAPLLFISLVENMFKHGVAANKQLKSFIHIDIYTDENQTIVCKLKNSHHPKDTTSDKSGSGIGIENLKRRLELIYPSNHSFTSGVEENVYYSTLIINPIIKNEI